MELNREQVVKVLECCASPMQMCKDCPMPEETKDDCRCMETISRNTLALIKELTEENKAWQMQLISQEEKSGKAYYDLACKVEDLRADTVRKMQERFNRIFGGMDVTSILLRKTFDQIAKEMLKENE